MSHFSDKFRVKVGEGGKVYLAIAYDERFVEEYRIDAEEWIRMFSFASEGANYRTSKISVKHKGRDVQVFFQIGEGYRKGFSCTISEFRFLSSRLSASLHGLRTRSDMAARMDSDLSEKTQEEYFLTLGDQFASSVENMSMTILNKIANLEEKIANISMGERMVTHSLDISSEPVIHLPNETENVSFSIFEDDDEMFIPETFAKDLKGNVFTSQTESTDSADAAADALNQLRRKDK